MRQVLRRSTRCNGCRACCRSTRSISAQSILNWRSTRGVSFASNTSWQSYAGETTLSYLSQMAGITVQSLLSAATGIAVAVALVRGFARRNSRTVGNFWVDMSRALLYVVLPISAAAAIFLVWQGVPQTLDGAVGVTTLEGAQQLS